MLNQLLYRSKQRGYLELDLLVGEFFERQAPSFTRDQINQATVVLGEENPDLWSWLTGQDDPPERLKSNEVFQVCSPCKVQCECCTSSMPALDGARIRSAGTQPFKVGNIQTHIYVQGVSAYECC
jgi:succinate dehydrogenase flavin-adding protein (antitoxin of CptAB toxin-antitoxin module)